MERKNAVFGSAAFVLIVLIVLVFVLVQRDEIAGKAWGITYRAEGKGAMAVTYQDTKSRYLWGDRMVREHAEQNVQPGWSKEVLIAAKRQAKITVTPSPGATAHCLILLDDRKVLEEAASPAPGQPAVCVTDIQS